MPSEREKRSDGIFDCAYIQRTSFMMLFPIQILRHQAHWGVGGAVLVVAAAAFADFKEKAVFNQLRISVQEFAAVAVGIVEQMMFAQTVDKIVGQTEPRLQIVVIVLRDVEQVGTVLTHKGHGFKNIVAGKGDVLQAGAFVVGH